jgi:hypothetical protein
MRFFAQIFTWRRNSVESNTILWISLACAATLIPLWSIPHTMAARNILFFCSLVGVVVSGLNWSIYKGRLNIFLLLCLYLVFQIIFFSIDITEAIKNFRSEWLRFILCFILGLGIALAISKCGVKKALFWLGILFAIPPLLHLVQIIYAWNIAGKFPWGYLGLFAMHGDLAYTSLASVIFLNVYLYFRANRWGEYFLTYTLIAMCLISPAVAKSRGGVLFGILSILFIVLISLFGPKNIRSMQTNIVKAISIICLFGMTFLTIYVLSVADPLRWNGFMSRVNLGLVSASSALDISCNAGIRPEHSDLNLTDRSKAVLNKAEVLNLAEGDGARVIGVVSGIQLAIANPMGINQSRQAYQTALINYCGYIPKTILSHSHNGLVNAALAIGIPGVCILLALYFSLLREGLKNIPNIYALALAFWVLIWLIRALFDATLQDQTLEFQAFILALLLGLSIQNK